MAGPLSVGARLETVQARPLTDWTDRLNILILLAAAIAIHYVVLMRTEMTARDSIGFARTAMQLLEPNQARTPQDPAGLQLSFLDVILRSQHPPGYAVAVLGMSELVHFLKPVSEAERPAQLLLATQLVSAIAGVLLIFPLYWLGRMLLGKLQGMAVALLFQFLPTPARVTSDGLTEGLYLLCLGSALFLAARAIRKPTISRFLLCGLTIGAAYLIRPEGLLVALAVSLALFHRILARVVSIKLGLALLTGLLVGFGITAGWYMVLIGGITQKPTGTNLLKNFNLRKQLQTQGAGAALPVKGPIFADWYNPEQHGSRATWLVQVFAKEGGKAFHFVPLVLAVIGLLVVLKKLREEPEWFVLYWYSALFVALLIAMAGFKPYDNANRPYLSERHLLPLVYVGCVFAIAGLFAIPRVLGPIRQPLGDRLAWLVLVLIVISCLPSLSRNLHGSRQGHREAGQILREQATEDDTIIDPFDYALWFSGRSLKTIKPDPAPKPGAYRWAVLEPGETSNSATPRLPAALAVANDQENKAELVKWWPSDKPESEAKVRLYKQRIK